MAKFDTDEIGKPGKPPKMRPFPWRLWLFAIVMTAGAGAGGYYTWQYRNQAQAADKEAITLRSSTAKLKADTDDAVKKKADCINLLDANNKKTKEQEIQLTALSSNLSASKEELTALQAQRAEAEKRVKAIQAIQEHFAKLIDTGELKVTARRGNLALSLPAEV